jgi:hypothetical protein
VTLGQVDGQQDAAEATSTAGATPRRVGEQY